MNYAKFEEGEVLFDTVHNRQVEINILPDKSNGIHPSEVLVKALDGEDAYRAKKKHLFTGDEIDTALSRERLSEIRKERLEYECSLLRKVDFDPDEITDEQIENLNEIDIRLDRIYQRLQKDAAKKYLDGDIDSHIPKSIVDLCMTSLRTIRSNGYQIL